MLCYFPRSAWAGDLINSTKEGRFHEVHANSEGVSSEM